MAERIKVEKFNFDKLVIERFLQDEIVEIKNGQTLKTGDVIVQNNTDGKYEKYVHGTHNANLHTMNLRIYTGDDVNSTNEAKGTAFRQGRLNIKMIGNLPADNSKYILINQLEKHNIFIEEEK